jgi:arabinose-5-phosphate isomerase
MAAAKKKSLLPFARKVLRTEGAAVLALADSLGPEFDRALALLARTRGRVVLTGMGKSGLICQKIAATLASTGTPAFFMHPAEAIHGDLGMVAPGDAVLAYSQSGETEETLKLLPSLKRLGVPLLALSGNPASTLARAAEVHLHVAIDAEACPMGLAPSASTTAALALGDALALALAESKGFKAEDFAALHPGGALGKKLAKVKDLMRAGTAIPRALPAARMRAVLDTLIAGRLGLVVIAQKDGTLYGLITDGDIKRLLARWPDLLDHRASECAVRTPRTIAESASVAEALNQLEANKITSLLVLRGKKIAGVVHLHDLWGSQLI